jgi:hypothetical protein
VEVTSRGVGDETTDAVVSNADITAINVNSILRIQQALVDQQDEESR